MGLRPTNNDGAGQKIARLSSNFVLLGVFMLFIFFSYAAAGIYEIASEVIHTCRR